MSCDTVRDGCTRSDPRTRRIPGTGGNQQWRRCGPTGVGRVWRSRRRVLPANLPLLCTRSINGVEMPVQRPDVNGVVVNRRRGSECPAARNGEIPNHMQCGYGRRIQYRFIGLTRELGCIVSISTPTRITAADTSKTDEREHKDSCTNL